MKIFILFLMLFTSQLAFGCYCVDTPLEKRYFESDYVYLGQVHSSTLGDNGVVTNELVVLEKIKGVADTKTVRNTLFPKDMCASHMVVGYKYVVFGKTGSIPEISSCSNISSLGDIGKEGLAQLQEMANK
ncbi:hypothetical protein [Microbulbifer taiwanensis]|uniref:DUF4156 domain-containing protein n=1 Tax=Microbulbifer taiwanensis TaxID=986746 RepID=A0ABW1YKV7_9GAMM|nr:hypothetical protein [Microbulbifer taiwanensis]